MAQTVPSLRPRRRAGWPSLASDSPEPDRPAALPSRPAAERDMLAKALRAAMGGVLAIPLGLAIGCGSEDRVIESTARYQPPTEHRVIVETVVEAPFEDVWEALARHLSETSFRILALDQASRFMVVELDRSTDAARAASPPERFVDCGRMHRSLEEEGRAQALEYEVAGASRHREVHAEEAAYEVRDVSRAVDLKARSSLYLEPEGARRTRVTVNSRYTLTIETTGTTRRRPRDASAPETEPRELEPLREEIRLTTFAPSARPLDAGATTGSQGSSSPAGTSQSAVATDRICRATGELERALLELVESAAGAARRTASLQGSTRPAGHRSLSAQS